MKSNTLGEIGEDLACGFLKNRGYRIIARNYRKPWGEIDIIGKAKDGTLVFFEVKTLREFGEDSLKPEDNLSAFKLRKFRKICQTFANKNQNLINEKKGWQMDLIAITVKNPVGDLSNEENCIIRHYENIM